MPNKERKSAAEPKNLVQFLRPRRSESFSVLLRQFTVDALEQDAVTIDTGSGLVQGVKYLDSYTPSIGDTVWCLESGSDIIILGKLA